MQRQRVRNPILSVLMLLVANSASAAQQCSSQMFEVDSTICGWQNSGVTVAVGDAVELTARGMVRVWMDPGTSNKLWYSPLGSSAQGEAGWVGCPTIDHLVPGCEFYERGLVGRIGTGAPFNVGLHSLFVADEAGELMLGINETQNGGCADNLGSWQVAIVMNRVPREDVHVAEVDSANCGWQSSGVRVDAGEVVEVSATGMVRVWQGAGRELWYTPYGASAHGFSALFGCPGANHLVPGCEYYERGLVGRIGGGAPFSIGGHRVFVAQDSGMLSLAINETSGRCGDNVGVWSATIVKNRTFPNDSSFVLDSRNCDWQGTGLEVAVGDMVELTTTDMVRVWEGSGNTLWFSPHGPSAQGFGVPGNNGGNGGNLYDRGIIGRIGTGTEFNIGSSAMIFADASGPLELRIGETAGGCGDNEGVWVVRASISSDWNCPRACYADCDHSTGPYVLDIFDFLCFQSSFVTGEPYACDCDVSTGPGVCDIFDFLCFQNAFVAGCP